MSWPLKKLGALVAIKTGRLDANAADEDGIYPFFTCSREPLKINTHAFECDAILIAGNGDLNVKHYNGRFNAYQRTYVITSLSSEILDTRYLFYFMDKYVERLRELSIGGVIKYIKLGMLTDAKIPLPPLFEQKRIADILDKADAIRRKRRQAIQLADDFLRAVFLDMFGDPVTNFKGFPIGTIRDLVATTNYGSSVKASETEGQYPILRMGNLTYQGRLDLSDLKYIDLDEVDKPKYMVSKGDLLFNRTNSKELVGKSAVYDRDDPVAIAGYLVRVRPNELGNSYYLAGYLNSAHGKSTLRGMCKSIVGMANINAQEMQNISILVPPVTLQERYQEIVIATKARVGKFDSGFELNSQLFASLSEKAFSGQI